MATSYAKMAKKKQAQAERGRSEERVTILGLKGTRAFNGWLGRLVKHSRLPLPTLVEHALIHYAKQLGFEEDPPER